MARRTLAIFAAGVLLLTLGLATVLYHPTVQGFAAQRVADYLSQLTGFGISIRRIEIPVRGREILIHDIVVEVPKGHVALSARRVAVTMDLAALGAGRVVIPRIHLSDAFAGVSIRDGRAEPVETIIDTIEKLAGESQPQPQDESSVLELGILSWSDVRGYFWHEDPSMVGTATVSGQLDLSQWPVRGPYQGENLEYMVLDWPFTASRTEGQMIIGDWFRLEGTLPTSMPQGNLNYTVEVSTETGDVVVHAGGVLDTGIVPAHFSPYPYLEGTAAVDVSLGQDEAFWLQARVSSDTLRIEERGEIQRLHVRMDMNDERMHFTEIRGKLLDVDRSRSGQLDVTGAIVFGPPVDLYFGGLVRGIDLAHIRQTFSPVDLDLAMGGHYDGRLSAGLRVSDTVSVLAQLDGRATSMTAALGELAHGDEDLRLRARAQIETEPFGLELSVAEWRGQTSAITGEIAYTEVAGLTMDVRGQLGSRSLPWSQWLPAIDRVGSLNFAARRESAGAFEGRFAARGLRLPWLRPELNSQARVFSRDGHVFEISDAQIQAGDSQILGSAQVDLDRELLDLNINAASMELSDLRWAPDLVLTGRVDMSASVEYQWGREWVSAVEIDSLSAPILTLGGAVDVTMPEIACHGTGANTLECAVGLGSAQLQAQLRPKWGVAMDVQIEQVDLDDLWLASAQIRGQVSSRMRLERAQGLWQIAGWLQGGSVMLSKYPMGNVRSDFSLVQTTDDWSVHMSLMAANDATQFAAAYSRDPGLVASQSLWLMAQMPGQYDVLADGSLGISGSGLGYLNWQSDVLVDAGVFLDSFALRQGGSDLARLQQPVAFSVAGGDEQRVELAWLFRGETAPRLWPVELALTDANQWSIRATASAPLRALESFVPLIRFGEGAVAGETIFGLGRDGYYLSGDLSFTSAALALPELGLSGRLLGGRARLTNWLIDLSDLEIQTETGMLDGSARINLGAPALSIAGDLGLDSITVRPASGIEARVSGPVSLLYSDPGPMYVRGKLELLGGLLNDRIDWEQSLLKFQKRDKRALSTVQNAPVVLQLVFANDSALRIDNNLAKLTVDGDFSLVGAADSPGIMGNLVAESGDLVWQGQVYGIESALVQFVNPLELNPQVDLRAKTNVEEQSGDDFGAARQYQVILHAHGELDSLQVDYDSDPYLPKEEIVSLLTFGVTNLSGDSGQAGVTNFLLSPQLAPIESAVEDITGFDKFDLLQTYNDKAEVNTMSVRLQKRFTNKLRMNVESSVDQVGGQRVGFDYGITRSLSLSLGWDNDAVEQTGNFSIQPRFRIPLP